MWRNWKQVVLVAHHQLARHIIITDIIIITVIIIVNVIITLVTIIIVSVEKLEAGGCRPSGGESPGIVSCHDFQHFGQNLIKLMSINRISLHIIRVSISTDPLMDFCQGVRVVSVFVSDNVEMAWSTSFQPNVEACAICALCFFSSEMVWI